MSGSSLGITNSAYQAGSLGANALPQIMETIQVLIECAQQTNEEKLDNIKSEFDTMATALHTGLQIASNTEVKAWIDGATNILSGAVGIGTQLVAGAKTAENGAAYDDANKQLTNLRETYDPAKLYSENELEISRQNPSPKTPEEVEAATDRTATTQADLKEGNFGDLRRTLPNEEKEHIREAGGEMKNTDVPSYEEYTKQYKAKEENLSRDANTNMSAQQKISAEWQQYGQIIDSIVVKAAGGIGSGYMQADIAKLEALKQLFSQLAQSMDKVVDINNQGSNGAYQSVEALVQGLGRTYQG